MPRKNHTRKRKSKSSLKGGVYRPSRTVKKTIRRKPVGYELPRRELHFNYTKRIPPTQNMIPYVLNIAMKKTQKIRPEINVLQNIPVQKLSTYQYIKSIQRILEQILIDLELEPEEPKYEIAATSAAMIAASLSELQSELDLEVDEELEEDDDKIEEILDIISTYLKKYNKVLKKGNLNRIELVEAELVLIATTLDEALQEAKSVLLNTQNVGNSMNTLNTLNTFNTSVNQVANNGTNLNSLVSLLGALDPFQK